MQQLQSLQEKLNQKQNFSEQKQHHNLSNHSLDENVLYQTFFLHYFVDSSKHKFTYLQEKLKNYKYPTLEHSKKTNQLGYMKKYSSICQIMKYSSNMKIQKKVEVSKIQQIIKSVYHAYQYYFMNGGYNRIDLVHKPNQKESSAYMQEFLLMRLCEVYPQFKATHNSNSQYGILSLDKFILSFFFTLNYIKSCNLQMKSFVNLLTIQQNNIIDTFLNFILRRKCSNKIFSSFQTTIRVDFVQKIIRIIQDQSVQQMVNKKKRKCSQNNSNVNNSSLLSQFSTIKQQQNQSFQSNSNANHNSLHFNNDSQVVQIRTVIALQIISNFLKQHKDNKKYRISQVKIYKLLKVVDLIQKKELKQASQNVVNWQQVLTFCFSKLQRQEYSKFLQSSQQQNIQSCISIDSTSCNKVSSSSYDRLLLLALTQKNYLLSQKLLQKSNSQKFQNQKNFANKQWQKQKQTPIVQKTQQQLIHQTQKAAFKFQLIQKYREQSFQFIFSYIQQLFQAKSFQDNEHFQLYQKLKSIYNYGILVIKPLLVKILKHQQLNKLFKRYCELLNLFQKQQFQQQNNEHKKCLKTKIKPPCSCKIQLQDKLTSENNKNQQIFPF